METLTVSGERVSQRNLKARDGLELASLRSRDFDSC